MLAATYVDNVKKALDYLQANVSSELLLIQLALFLFCTHYYFLWKFHSFKYLSLYHTHVGQAHIIIQILTTFLLGVKNVTRVIIILASM